MSDLGTASPHPRAEHQAHSRSDGIVSRRIAARQTGIDISVRRALSVIAWSRCHLVCQWPWASRHGPGTPGGNGGGQDGAHDRGPAGYGEEVRVTAQSTNVMLPWETSRSMRSSTRYRIVQPPPTRARRWICLPAVGLVMAVALLVTEQTGVQVDQVLVASAALHVGNDAARARGRRLGVQVPAGPVIAGARGSSGRRALDD